MKTPLFPFGCSAKSATGALALFLLFLGACAKEPPLGPEILRQIQASCSAQPSFVGDRLVCAGASAQGFYERRGYRPAWTDEGRVLPRAFELIGVLEKAPEHGLRAEDYHLETLRLRSRGRPRGKKRLSAAEAAEFDLLLTDAFLLYGAHLLGGRVDPVTIHPDWLANRRTGDVARVLERALESGRIAAELEGLAPQHPEYARLRGALRVYREKAAHGEWPKVGGGPVLRPGSRGPRVLLLRNRLRLELAGVEAAAEPELFDRGLASAVRAFQGGRGLRPDGVVGPGTLAALDVPAAQRVRQLGVNLERWRWMPQSLGERHVRVNVAGFELEVREGATTVLAMGVVVGKPFTRTPVFSSAVTHVVLNPTWNVPESIAREELLPAAAKDPFFLSENGFRVFRGWGARAPEVDPLEVDWTALSPEELDLSFRQSPGPGNALGRIKFLLPNRFDVYLHDTPARGLFSVPRRAFSHGCIRVEKASELAEYLLKGQPRWSREALLAAVSEGSEQVIRMRQSVPVHLVYQTAWVGSDGGLRFGEDIYGRDEPLAQALESPSPSAL